MSATLLLILGIIILCIILVLIKNNLPIRKIWVNFLGFNSGVEVGGNNRGFDFSGKILANEVWLYKKGNKGVVRIVDGKNIIATIRTDNWQGMDFSTKGYKELKEITSKQRIFQEFPEKLHPPIYLTKKGLIRIKREYKELYNLLPQGEIEEDRAKIKFLKIRLSGLKYALNNVEFITPPIGKEKNRVHLGATVLVDIKGRKELLTIVGTMEADPLRGKISNESPVGKALMNRSIGDVATVELPNDPYHNEYHKIKLVDIQYKKETFS